MRQYFIKTILILCGLIGSSFAYGNSKVNGDETLTIAVASNFLATMQKLIVEYSGAGKPKIKVSSGSSGKYVAQIKQGAPFDLFFSADIARAKQLEDDGDAIAGSRFTYAVGRLALWGSGDIELDHQEVALNSPNLTHLAIANPRLAPYGVAAQQALESLGLWSELQSKLVRGENINQAYQFVASGNAQLGFVSYAQVIATNINNQDANAQAGFWLIPKTHHDAIEQQAVTLKESLAVKDFITFIQSATAKRIIQESGYEVP